MPAIIPFPKDVVQFLCQVFSATFMTLFFIIAVYHMITTQRATGFKFKNSQQSIYLSFLLLVFAFLSLVGVVSLAFDTKATLMFCKVTQFGGMTAYVAFKTVLYLILVLRLKEAFGGSAIQYDNRKLSIWAAILIAWNVVDVTLLVGTTGIHIDPDQKQPPFCILDLKMYALASLALVDVVGGIGNSYLFIRQIYKVTKQLALFEASDTDTGHNLRNVAIKQGVLSIIATTTTIITMVCLALFDMPPVFVSVDVCASVLCIILMYRWNSHFVNKLCLCCITKEMTIDEKNMSITDIHVTTTNGKTDMIIHSEPTGATQYSSQNEVNQSEMQVCTTNNTMNISNNNQAKFPVLEWRQLSVPIVSSQVEKPDLRQIVSECRWKTKKNDV